jgi:S-adenosylmethionine:tRNA ribosyltransferase-isomerase
MANGKLSFGTDGQAGFDFIAGMPLSSVVRTSEFFFDLPSGLIAQTPATERDQSRLMVLRRDSGRVAHRRFADWLEYLQPGDVVVLNDSKVIAARLRGVNKNSGGEFEVLLLEENALNDWWVMLRPGKRARLNTEIVFRNRAGALTDITAMVVEKNSEGLRRLNFSGTPNVAETLEELGEVPLPPYIKRTGSNLLETDLDRYQTIYAQANGSVAAPTAGLHFTRQLLARVRALGAKICFVTLHVGLGTFAPVKTENITQHVMHEERFIIGPETAGIINTAKRAGHRLFAVGTTTVRVLEDVAANNHSLLAAVAGRTSIFIYPPYRFQVVDALITNFHLPCSTLLMLVSAFAAPNESRGREMILSAYAEAVRQRYRFFSYGDAMLIL